MSINILKDNALDIDIALIKKVRVEENGEIVPKILEIVNLELSAIVNFTLRDSLTLHGYSGSLTVNNKSKILDKLQITSGVPDDVYVKFIISSKDLDESSERDKMQTDLRGLCLVKSTEAASSNIEDNIVILEFEEAVIAEMKYTKWDSIYINNPNYDGQEIDIIELVDTFYDFTLKEESEIDRITLPSQGSDVGSSQASPLVEEAKSDSDRADDLTVYTNNFSEKPSIKIPYLESQEVDEDEKDATVYDAFKEQLKKTTVKYGSSSDSYLLPTFRFVNATDGRRMRFAAVFTDRHREFVKAIEQGDARNFSFGTDFSDVYLEKFNIGPLAQAQGIVDKNTSWQNTIETHDIVPPDVQTLREERWTDVGLVGSTKKEYNAGSTEITFVRYGDAMKIFAEKNLDIGESGLNLPLLPYKTIPEKKIFKKGDFPDREMAMQNRAFNRIISSFVLVNEQLHFTTKGKVYRLPGKFIVVDSGESIAKEKPQDIKDRLKQVWFVTSVTHIIDNGEYTTEFICNRFFGDHGLDTVNVYAEVGGNSVAANVARIGKRAGRVAKAAVAEAAAEKTVQENIDELAKESGVDVPAETDAEQADGQVSAEDLPAGGQRDAVANNVVDENVISTTSGNTGSTSTTGPSLTDEGYTLTSSQYTVRADNRDDAQKKIKEAEAEVYRQTELLINKRNARGKELYDDEAAALEHKILKDRGVISGDFDHDAYGPADERTYNPANYS